ncbi:positive regulation of fibroblast apoptotic process [Mactra antiquata]
MSQRNGPVNLHYHNAIKSTNSAVYTPTTDIVSEPLTDKYEVGENIGRGKFAVVRKCTHKQTNEIVAAKFIKKRRRGKSCREEILREVVMLEMALDHPRLVNLKEVYETQHELILITEYCAGGELFTECILEEKFDERDVKVLMSQILEGLIYLHNKNIVHLDLKPQNILLTDEFPRGSVKICDLGFACLVNTGEDIRDIIGTPDYVAPEVLNYDSLGLYTDMWSLGVLTYVMLTTCSPFAAEDKQMTFSNITSVNVDFPDELFSNISMAAIDFIQKLLIAEPEERMTAKECLNHEWLQGVSQLSKSLNTSENEVEQSALTSDVSNFVPKSESLDVMIENNIGYSEGNNISTENSSDNSEVDLVSKNTEDEESTDMFETQSTSTSVLDGETMTHINDAEPISESTAIISTSVPEKLYKHVPIDSVTSEHDVSPDGDSSILNSDTNLLESDTNLPESDTNLLESDTNLPESDTNLLESDTNIPESDTNLLESDTNLPESDTYLLESDANLPETDYNLLESNTNLPESDTNLLESDMNVPESDSGMVTCSDSRSVESVDLSGRASTDLDFSETTRTDPIDDYELCSKEDSGENSSGMDDITKDADNVIEPSNNIGNVDSNVEMDVDHSRNLADEDVAQMNDNNSANSAQNLTLKEQQAMSPVSASPSEIYVVGSCSNSVNNDSIKSPVKGNFDCENIDANITTPVTGYRPHLNSVGNIDDSINSMQLGERHKRGMCNDSSSLGNEDCDHTDEHEYEFVSVSKRVRSIEESITVPTSPPFSPKIARSPRIGRHSRYHPHQHH